ncbi:hypothetical protein SAMN02745245_01033 [Anaerosphaera aminiphila DSM 21120]|uniref:Uncharacterized protein n=1 Tax=Anaerosphaera aminiphila DSM 21120 TaxID=1120995 RepID=A0A1M5RWX1_9FIRM|nr:hypothetical protein [Anaerosphaera aminiphila]SHH30857.1 hypothetical protein SAMN02745245_01033 [Anaerosphaera aminiphila DSM 21120]
MFEILYNNKKYIPKAALKINCSDYLVLAMDLDDNFIFIHSKDIFELRENPEILKDILVPLTKDEIYNMKQSELKKKDIVEFKNIKLNALNFRELLSLYKKFEFAEEGSSVVFKSRIVSGLKKNLYDCKNNGKVDFKDDIKSLIKNSYEFNLGSVSDYELKEILMEYTVFLKTKVYEKMSLYELLKEHSRFVNVLNGNMEIEKLGFPNVDLFTLRDSIEPAVRVLIYLKEDIILTELLNVTRHALEKNPFTIKRKDIEEVDEEFHFNEEAKFNYNYLFYESLGIDTDFAYDELSNLNKWEFSEVSEHLFKISESVLKEYKDRDEFLNACKESLIVYEDVEFVKYFISHLFTTLERG